MDCPTCRAPGICVCPPSPTPPPRDLTPTRGVTYAELRAANARRLPLFRNARGEPAHARADGADWSLASWSNATLGELGEAANLVKKLQRGDMTLEAARAAIGDEIADAMTYLDIFAAQAGVDLGREICLRHVGHADRIGYQGFRPPVEPLPELSNRAFAALGVAASAVDCLAGATPREILPIMADKMAAGAVALEAMAAAIGVDLGRAVAAKFNRVSARVGCDVFLGLAPEPILPPADDPFARRAAMVAAILAERARQVDEEGFSAAHDAGHGDGALARAAACYAANAASGDFDLAAPPAWPWTDAEWKPRGPRRDLIRAGALILAELERLGPATGGSLPA